MGNKTKVEFVIFELVPGCSLADDWQPELVPCTWCMAVVFSRCCSTRDELEKLRKRTGKSKTRLDILVKCYLGYCPPHWGDINGPYWTVLSHQAHNTWYRTLYSVYIAVTWILGSTDSLLFVFCGQHCKLAWMDKNRSGITLNYRDSLEYGCTVNLG